jgi:hypothetical protein
MAEIVASVDIAAPADVVWAAITDWDRQGEWMLGTSVRATALNGRGVGGALEGRTALGPVGFTDTMTITRWDPPVRCEVVHHGWLVSGSAVFEVVPLDVGHARFLWVEWLRPPLGLLGTVGLLLTKPLALLGLRLSLRRLARWAPEHPVRPGETLR